MSRFRYTAQTPTGTRVTGHRRARCIGDLRRTLEDRHLTVMDIDDTVPRWQRDITPPTTKRTVLVHFTRQLGVFVRSGVQLATALHILHEETDDRALRRALNAIVVDITRGDALSVAVARHPQVFPHYYVGMLRSAERTGGLDDALRSLAAYLQREIDTRASVTGALVYPALVAGLSVITVAVLTGYVLPRFEELFDELGADLPTATRILLGVSHLVSANLLMALGASTSLAATGIWMLTSRRGRMIRDRLILRIPLVRGVVHYVIVERFCRILTAMVRCGVPVSDGLAMAGQSTRNTVVRRRLERARSEIENGRGFAIPLQETGLFPAAATQMFRIGEETGTLDDQLAATSEYLDVELAQRIRRFTALFEPAMIIGVGLTVGFVAVALVSAMYGVLDGVESP